MSLRFMYLVVILVLIMATACAADPELSESDEAAIYSAVLHRMYTQDDTFGGAFNAPTVYVVATTDDSVGDPEIEQTAPRSLDKTIQDDIVDNLAGLPARIIWVDDSSEVTLDSTNGAVIVHQYVDDYQASNQGCPLSIKRSSAYRTRQ